MDANNLKKLKNSTKDTSVMYVEDSIVLQKQVSKFLGNVFDRFFQAKDGTAGLEIFIEEEPDIVITDIDMPKKNGIEMIEEMKKINPDANIIVLTAHHDQKTLFKTMSLGVANFLPKPLNIDKLVVTLLNDIEMISKMQKIKCMNDLHIIKNHNVELSFYNTYKGVPIQDSGNVIELTEDAIKFQVTPKQYAVIEDQGFTLIKVPEVKKYIKAQVDSYDVFNKEIIVSKPRYINFKARSVADKRLKVDKTFKLTIDMDGKKIETYPYDASFAALGLLVNDTLPVVVGDEVDVEIAFNTPVKDKKGALITNNRYKTQSRCNVLRAQYSANTTILALQVNLEGENKTFYEKYLHYLEATVIDELKTLIIKVA